MYIIFISSPCQVSHSPVLAEVPPAINAYNEGRTGDKPTTCGMLWKDHEALPDMFRLSIRTASYNVPPAAVAKIYFGLSQTLGNVMNIST